MSATRLLSYKKILQVMGAVSVIFLTSCGVVPKNYPKKQPFVFKYNVAVEGNENGPQTYLQGYQPARFKQAPDLRQQ
jgi:hypothetical protein